MPLSEQLEAVFPSFSMLSLLFSQSGGRRELTHNMHIHSITYRGFLEAGHAIRRIGCRCTKRRGTRTVGSMAVRCFEAAQPPIGGSHGSGCCTGWFPVQQGSAECGCAALRRASTRMQSCKQNNTDLWQRTCPAVPDARTMYFTVQQSSRPFAMCEARIGVPSPAPTHTGTVCPPERFYM